MKALDGSQPHESWGGWDNFLATCELRDEYDGTRYFGKTNCNYIVFPNDVIVQNFGYNGEVLMRAVRESGSQVVWDEVLDNYLVTRDVTKELCIAIDRLTDSLNKAPSSG
jgi:hypothetical protein